MNIDRMQPYQANPEYRAHRVVHKDLCCEFLTQSLLLILK